MIPILKHIIAMIKAILHIVIHGVEDEVKKIAVEAKAIETKAAEPIIDPIP